MLLIQTARFAPGQIVQHRSLGYRGLIYDVDPVFIEPKEGMIDTISLDELDRPWYHILIEGEDMISYVVESSIEASVDVSNFAHPLMGSFFDGVTPDGYASRYAVN